MKGAIADRRVRHRQAHAAERESGWRKKPDGRYVPGPYRVESSPPGGETSRSGPDAAGHLRTIRAEDAETNGSEVRATPSKGWSQKAGVADGRLQARWSGRIEAPRS